MPHVFCLYLKSCLKSTTFYSRRITVRFNSGINSIIINSIITSDNNFMISENNPKIYAALAAIVVTLFQNQFYLL